MNNNKIIYWGQEQFIKHIFILIFKFNQLTASDKKEN